MNGPQQWARWKHPHVNPSKWHALNPGKKLDETAQMTRCGQLVWDHYFRSGIAVMGQDDPPDDDNDYAVCLLCLRSVEMERRREAL